MPPIPGVKEAYEKGIVVTSRELLNVKNYPKSIVIVGGGVIGVEFATVFNSFGSKVTIIEMMDGILPTMDDDIRTAYTKTLKRDGIEILTKAEVKKVDDHKVTYSLDGKETTIEGDLILMSVGTRANSKGLEHLGLEMDRANIKTNEYLQTNVPGVYAIGDVNGKFMLAHVAEHEGITAVQHILKNRSR